MSLWERLADSAFTLSHLPRNLSRTLRFHGRERWCPICHRSARLFRSGGIIKRDEATCAFCGAMERHRLAWLYLDQHTDLFDGREKTVLHVAAEPCYERLLKRRLQHRYLTADLSNPRAMVQMDITCIDQPADRFDVILCSHVLEHIPEDRQAMRELFRVLKPGGWALLAVPITGETTEEDPLVIAPAERLARYGHEEHVRNYGRDYGDRLRSCGFTVEEIPASALADAAGCVRMGFTVAAGSIYRCSKPE